MIYNNSADHEKRLQGYELNYLFNLDNYWINGNLWILSSFRKSGAYYRSNILIYKLIFLCIFIFVRNNLAIQGFLFWFFILILNVQYCFLYLPYRCESSNKIHISCFLLLFINSSFGSVNSFGVKSYFTVSFSQFLW